MSGHQDGQFNLTADRLARETEEPDLLMEALLKDRALPLADALVRLGDAKLDRLKMARRLNDADQLAADLELEYKETIQVEEDAGYNLLTLLDNQIVTAFQESRNG